MTHTRRRALIACVLLALACGSEGVVIIEPSPFGVQLSGSVLTTLDAPVAGARVSAEILVLMPQGPRLFDTAIRDTDGFGRFDMAPYYYGFFADSIVRFRVTVQPPAGSGLASATDSVTVTAKRAGVRAAALTLRVARLQ